MFWFDWIDALNVFRLTWQIDSQRWRRDPVKPRLTAARLASVFLPAKTPRQKGSKHESTMGGREREWWLAPKRLTPAVASNLHHSVYGICR